MNPIAEIVGNVVPCEACDGHGYHVVQRAQGIHTDTCDITIYDCGKCKGEGVVIGLRAAPEAV